MLKQHPKYEHLYLSQTGDVYSTKTNKFLSFVKHKRGYLVFHTKLNGRDSKGILLRVHRLVAETYLENPLCKPFVNHKDGNKTNNNLVNLEWVTSKENTLHAYKTGLQKALARDVNPASKLTEDQVNYIRLMYKPRDKQYGSRALAKSLGVCHTTISRIMSGARKGSCTPMP